MNNKLNIIYTYVAFGFFGIVLETLNIFRPIAGICAGISLLFASYYIGKFAGPKK